MEMQKGKYVKIANLFDALRNKENNLLALLKKEEEKIFL